MSVARPDTWQGVAAGMAELWSGPDGEEIAWDFLRGAVSARWRVESMRDMNPAQRHVAFQKSLGVLYALRDEGDLAVVCGLRGIVAGAFARYFDGVLVDGPPWRIDPMETGRMTYADWKGAADFGEPESASAPIYASEPSPESAPNHAERAADVRACLTTGASHEC